MAKERIQKALSDAGVLSRRKTEELVARGKITVNGHRAEPGQPIDIARDVVVVEGARVQFKRRKENIYIMLNKPRGYVTTTSDELGRRCVTELVEDLEERVYPVGRLDKNTEGLLLMTNDGQFANQMMHPRSHVTKTYRLTVRPDISEDQLIKLSTGVQIGEDLTTLPASVIVQEKAPGRVVLQITITEGKNRQIRRMCEAVGLEVARLKRVSVGPLRLGMLQPGQWRELTKAEVISLRNAGTLTDEVVNAPGEGRDSRGKAPRHGGKPRGEAAMPRGGAADDTTKPRRGGSDSDTSKPRRGAARPGGKPAYGAKPTGGKPAYGAKPTGDKPTYGAKPAYGAKPTGDKPTYGAKPAYGAKPTGGKPAYGAKPTGDKPTYGAKPAYGAKPTGGKPAYGTKPTGSKPAYGAKKPASQRPSGRPARPATGREKK